ncbi:hypothetical protein G6F46_003343 [Rhizopus delemar]|uniref:Reverse transcriptase zinc-binding domain-containing protein n=3 Tax=Rhizopus TaxID=4842 RepID=I1C4H0_RHIO9|nr:hypothetical protein RO3G_08055 [Rhizopus delemar RA 99-880]KAG1457698.1 hypothetical protein G6F55_005773 [Rhizopus delemar]KAG1548559.1 hypothetical protein G6F51_003594 [Rhizopus arrhizus]KAG1495226.1 hypothetical protein G6F54_007319 [Rhizopus delemar]KAG1515282.1 hypothetical protein G6F53_003036 [Rhizopus delemar]|eukprot:EIE83350.1 hypothetical protein RO3G_08055 [Rhizopus delemar RA 99-880]
MPAAFLDACCPICRVNEDTLEHFLYQCPVKLVVWRTSWSRFTNPTEFNVDRVQNALFCLKFPPKVSSSSQGPPSTIIGHTLMGIWRAHWAFIFDSVPFHPDLVSKSVSLMITTTHKENLLLSGCSPVPLPHIQP